MRSNPVLLALGLLVGSSVAAPSVAEAAPPEVLRGFDNPQMPTRLYNGAQDFGLKTFNMNTRTWSSSWVPQTTISPGSFGHMVPIRWKQAYWPGDLERHDLFAVDDSGQAMHQLWTYNQIGNGLPHVVNHTPHNVQFYAKTGFPQSGPSVKNLFGTDKRGDNLYTPAPVTVIDEATKLIEYYWNGQGWTHIDRGAPDGAREILLGPEGAVWYDHEAVVCMSVPGKVVCKTFHDGRWSDYSLPIITRGSPSWVDRVTLRQAPVVVRYSRGDDFYFRVFVVGWDPTLNAGAGEWRTYGIERQATGNPWLWGSEAGVSRWMDYGPPPNVEQPKKGDGPGLDPEDFAYSLTAYSEFQESGVSWVNVFGHDIQGDKVIDMYFGGSTPRHWQWGGGQNSPAAGFQISSATAQVDSNRKWRVSAFGVSGSGQIYERYFDTALGGGWFYLAL